MNISVVIITKNEAANISECIESARQLSNDIVVVDSGSADETVSIAMRNGATIVAQRWDGFGNARNAGAKSAKHDWIFSLDADERISSSLVESIRRLEPEDPSVIYGFKRQSYLVSKKIRFGDWGRDRVYRIYRRDRTAWNLFPVHEALMTGVHTRKRIIRGNLEHYITKSIDRNREKMIRYAKLCASKYCLLGRKASVIKMFLSPVFSFLSGYIFRFGFLDGREGFDIARSAAYYTWLKYYYLQMLSH